MCVSFKNNCPLYGPTYDSIIIDHLDRDIDGHIWIGFVGKGCYKRDYYCVEVSMSTMFLNKLNESIIIDLKGQGTFEKPLVFDDKRQARRFLLRI